MTSTLTSTTVVPVDPNGGTDQLLNLIDLLPNAYKSHDLMLLAGMILAGIVILVRLWEKGRVVPDAWVPWVTFGLAFISAAAVGLEQHQALAAILTAGMVGGLVAVGGWATFEDMAIKVFNAIRNAIGGAPPGPPTAPATSTKTPPPNTPAVKPQDPPADPKAGAPACTDSDSCPRCHFGTLGFYTGLCTKCGYTTSSTPYLIETMRAVEGLHS